MIDREFSATEEHRHGTERMEMAVARTQIRSGCMHQDAVAGDDRIAPSGLPGQVDASDVRKRLVAGTADRNAMPDANAAGDKPVRTAVEYIGTPGASREEMAHRIAIASARYAAFRASSGIADAAPLRLDSVRLTATLERPSRLPINGDGFRYLLMCCALSAASDLTIQSGQCPRVEIDGRLYSLGDRNWSSSDVTTVLGETYRAANGMAEIFGLKVLDYPYDLTLLDGSKRRFRVNATGILTAGGYGVEMTIRLLPAAVPDITEVGISEGQAEAMSPRAGLVVIAGATGSGKSTTMAALTRRHLESTRRPVKIVDLQAPIEYAFHDSPAQRSAPGSIIGQSEIGRHVKSFEEGLRSALRRKPHIITIGEARDVATIAAALDAALTGHLVYTTLHAGSVEGCVRRLLAAFPAAERDHRACDLAASLRHLAVQRLAMRADGGGRVAVREYLDLDQQMAEQLADTSSVEWLPLISRRMASRDHGARRMRDSALELVESGIISQCEAERISNQIP